MASYDLVKNDSLGANSELNSSEGCDVCGSMDIIETYEGYSCRDCGIVLEVQKLEYHRPYDKDILQYAVINRTQIGTKKERFVINSSVRFGAMNKLDTHRTHEEMVINAAIVEIKRIITALKFPSRDLYPLLELFKYIRAQIGKGTKYKHPTMLIPCVIYAFYKGNNKPIHERELLEVARISKKDFNSFKYSIIRIWPQYQERNRKEYVVRRIFELTEHFKLGMPFFYQSKKILSKFYESIKNTKDDVIVGLVCSITLLCTRNNTCRVSNLCDILGIKMSAIQKQVEKKIFERFREGGFRSLVKSAGLLRKIMTKLGVFENKEDKEELEEKELVQITLGSASPVFNANEDLEYYLFVKSINELIVASVSSPKLYNSTQTKGEKPIVNSPHVELWKYYSPLGPPAVN